MKPTQQNIIKISSIISLLLCLFAISPPLYCQEENAPRGPSLQDYSLLLERNIFDPTRQGKVEEIVEEPVKSLPRRDEIHLVGTLVTDTGAYAFFNGNRRDFHRVLEINQILQDITITEITAENILVTINEQQHRLPVGYNLYRLDEGEWNVAETDSNHSFSNASSQISENSPTPEENQNDSSSNDSEENEILKRLMERRRQEMQK